MVLRAKDFLSNEALYIPGDKPQVTPGKLFKNSGND
jgi:hypothetical protein